ncbi:efflux RND transporter periplasmic adaptor subunit [Bowmanella dokdonensis]|uniref:Efflux RND transporter periplasmic adaptor subunit n=1 Tax=Bowmanella dokdonensis TaxID=751969 RepID=A0A939IMM3_9ALTE|nr:efflux RND transporter periplasmic adaptor subunit [Bowmanella dokdonensis]MBN7823950.1 efflux RND transporter periplasmic adaptor subunit [Bowmanella dokdonensis]
MQCTARVGQTQSRHGFWLPCCLLLCLAGCKGEAPEPEPPEPPLVETARAEHYGQDYKIAVKGFVRAPEQVRLVTEVSGIVADKSDRLEVGRRFARGEELFRLEQTDYQARVLQAQAELDNALVARSKARDNMARIQVLAAQNTASQARLDDAQLTLTNAEAQVKQARAHLQQADEALQDTRLEAPFDALIVSEEVSIGAYFSPAQTALTLIGADQLEVHAGLTPEQSAAVSRRLDASPATPIEVMPLDSQQRVIARLLSVSPVLDPDSRTINYAVLVDKTAQSDTVGLTVGEYVQVNFPARAENSLLLVPSASLRKNSHLYLLSQDNKLQKIPVTPVSYQDEGVLIKADKRLLDARLLLTSLVNESSGLQVRTRDD